MFTAKIWTFGELSKASVSRADNNNDNSVQGVFQHGGSFCIKDTRKSCTYSNSTTGAVAV